MSDEIKKRVVLASVLKPVDDTRMLEKIGPVLVSEGFDVFIIGYPSTRPVDGRGITVLALPKFNRISFKRFLMPWMVARKINEVNPEIIIVNTPELLFVTTLNKLFFRRKVVYDILENYYRTVRYTQTYPPVLKLLVAGMVRVTEVLFSPFVNRFLLAEKGYIDELNFVRKPVVIENKLPKEVTDKFKINRSPYYNLLFSGTLAPTTGVFDTIRLVKELHALNSRYNLTLIGYAALPDVLDKIQQEIAGVDYIRLIGGDRLVPHKDILHEISQAGTGVIFYPPNPATASSIPTKLYEYLAFKLPVIIAHTKTSNDLVMEGNAGIVLEAGVHASIINEQLANSTFSFSFGDTIFWETEAKELSKAFKNL